MRQSSGNNSGYHQINPHLIDLYYKKQVFEHDQSTAEIRAQMCDEMSRLLSATEVRSEREMIADILIALLKNAETDLKKALSERLSLFSDVPLRLLLQLVNDEVDVASPVLRLSPVLNDLDLLYIIQSRDAAFWRVIAHRQNVGESVVEALAETRDLSTAIILAENSSVTFSSYALEIIGDLAVGEDRLAESLLARGDIPEDFARKIYRYVGQDVLRRIEQKFEELPQDIRRNIEDVVTEFSVPVRGEDMPSIAMMRAAELFVEQGRMTPLLMVRTLRRGQLLSFIAQFSTLCGMSVEQVLPMLRRKDGQDLAILAHSVGISRKDFLAIYILTHKLDKNSSMATADEIAQALIRFDRITPELAKRLMCKTRH